ncbi:CS1-pili formation C-terminal domain-containing protein, partial [Escherichia coli]
SGAYILNAQNIVLDENGGFSFESSENEKELFLLKDKTIYSCSLDRSEMRNGIVFVGEVACNSTIKELLPEKLVTNSRIHDLLAYNQDTE